MHTWTQICNNTTKIYTSEQYIIGVVYVSVYNHVPLDCMRLNIRLFLSTCLTSDCE